MFSTVNCNGRVPRWGLHNNWNSRGPINDRILPGIDNKLTQIITFLSPKPVYVSMPLELAETRPRSMQFSIVESCFLKVQSAKLNTVVWHRIFWRNCSSTTRSHTCQHHAETTESHFRGTDMTDYPQPRIIFSSNNSSSASPMRRCEDHISQVLMKEISRECSSYRTYHCETNHYLSVTICQTVDHFKASEKIK